MSKTAKRRSNLAPAAAARFDAAAIADGKLKIPRQALRFAADAEVDDEAGDDGTVAVAISARSKKVLDHWFFGRIVHDFAGMRPASAKLPIDYCHNDAEVLGYSDKQDAEGGALVMRGRLIPFTDTDRASEVIHKSRLGMEYQGSIYFDPFELVLEFVPQGMTVEVNGDEFEGPGVVAREWMLRGVAVCPYGYDPNTAVALSQSPGDDDAVAVSFLESRQMTKTTKHAAKPNRHARRKAAALKGKKTPAKPAATKHAAKRPAGKKAGRLASDEAEEMEADEDAAEMEGDEEAVDDEAETDEAEESDCDCEGEEDCDCDDDVDTEAEEPVDAMEAEEEEDAEAPTEASKHKAGRGRLSAGSREARRFIAAFGAQGGIWYANGLTFDQAQTRFNKTTQKENAELRKKVDQQAAQLSALRGEADPVSFEPEEGAKKKAAGKQHSGLTAGASKFAAAIKLPK